MSRLLCLLTLIASVAALAGCGNKGKLYLPRPNVPASARTTATPASAASVPAAASSATGGA
jgi:predicted small lipoprotein YifL